VELAARARAIRLAAFDVDGVMTDGTLYIGAQGEAFKPFNILDGQGIKLLQSAGIAVAIITGRSSEAVAWRGRELGIGHVVQGAQDKVAELRTLAEGRGLDLAQCSFMGDDLADLEAMRACGLAVSVPNGVALVKEAAHYVTSTFGGKGAVREYCEWLLGQRGQLARASVVETD
jgi:3-deoxy-D-manno-octulosonate 8-phosphate phosphatase (KDO 8-P phosphatase)